MGGKLADKNGNLQEPPLHDGKTTRPLPEKSLPSLLHELCVTRSWTVTYEDLIKSPNSLQEMYALTGEALRHHPLYKTKRCTTQVSRQKSSSIMHILFYR
jgi:hypothetical protein